ncbi:MAG: hypothetical protein AOA65_0272 [Candidatus Bathyarchaeota archaeon BA1]|nr:MAG: hypothetical protein AOA65_0272 [Candidatus Bathyarchaeota archaeon BA1]
MAKFTKFTLFQDFDGTTFEEEAPLTSKVDVEELRTELGIPKYVDLSYFPLERAVVTIWASLNAQKLHELFSDVVSARIYKAPISSILFGGAAIKFHCPSTNDRSNPLHRDIKDVDFIVPMKQGAAFYKLLLILKDIAGTRYLHFKTYQDRRFNAMRKGRMYRAHTIRGFEKGSEPMVSVMDIFCDEINLRHNVKIVEEFKRPEESLHTIGLENMILSKCQFVFDLPVTALDELKKAEQDFRVLSSYKHYDPRKIIVGMEEKDMRDVCAILLDHDIGNGPDEICVSKIVKVLKKDKKFALTCSLNLQNIIERGDFLGKLGLTRSQISRVIDRVNSLLKAIPRVDKKWDKPWWNIDVETPKIFNPSQLSLQMKALPLHKHL